MRRGCIELCVYGASRIFRHKRGRMGGVSSDIVYLARGAREGKKQFLNIPWRATDMIVKEGFCKDICGWNFLARLEIFEQEWIVVLSESFFRNHERREVFGGMRWKAKRRRQERLVRFGTWLNKYNRRIEKDRASNRGAKIFFDIFWGLKQIVLGVEKKLLFLIIYKKCTLHCNIKSLNFRGVASIASMRDKDNCKSRDEQEGK